MRRSATGIALLAMLLVTLGAVIVLRGGYSAGTAPPTANILLAPEEGVAGDGPTGISIQIDTPPQPVAARGWPFQQLPLVAKFAVITPQVRPIPPLALRPVPIPERPFVPQPPVPSVPDLPGGPSPWLLAPLAGTVFIGGRDGAAPPTEVIPEPSTLILLSTGMLLLGLGAWVRRA